MPPWMNPQPYTLIDMFIHIVIDGMQYERLNEKTTWGWTTPL